MRLFGSEKINKFRELKKFNLPINRKTCLQKYYNSEIKMGTVIKPISPKTPSGPLEYPW